MNSSAPSISETISLAQQGQREIGRMLVRALGCAFGRRTASSR
jgi:hypothetical protein